MKKTTVLLLMAASLVFTSCATSKFYASRPSAISSIALVEPFSYITDAVGDWSTDYVDDVSIFNQKLVGDIVCSFGMPIQRVVAFDYDFTKPSTGLVRWMRNLEHVGSSDASNLIIPQEFRDVVGNSGCRYGMLLADIGFMKNADQLDLEHAIEVGVAVLDLVINNELYVGSDTEAYTNGVFSVIFDIETGRVVWFGARPRQYDHNPLDRRRLTEQLQTLYKDFI